MRIVEFRHGKGQVTISCVNDGIHDRELGLTREQFVASATKSAQRRFPEGTVLPEPSVDELRPGVWKVEFEISGSE